MVHLTSYNVFNNYYYSIIFFFIVFSAAHILEKFTNLEVLDLSDNFLEDDGKLSVEVLGQTLTHLPSLTTLLLPGGIKVKCGLDELMYHIKGLPKLSKLAFRRWNMTDDDVIKLAAHFTNNFGQLSFLDLSYNLVGNDGWIILIQALQDLKNLKHFDLSTEKTFNPIGGVVQTLCAAVESLSCLSSLKLDNWELDNIDIGKMKNIKLIHKEGVALEHFFLVEKK